MSDDVFQLIHLSLEFKMTDFDPVVGREWLYRPRYPGQQIRWMVCPPALQDLARATIEHASEIPQPEEEE